jgi:hypothetical protein
MSRVVAGVDLCDVLALTRGAEKVVPFFVIWRSVVL